MICIRVQALGWTQVGRLGAWTWCLSALQPKCWAVPLLVFYIAPGLRGGADWSSPFQLTRAHHERPAVSKVQMESCQQREFFRSAYCMIHPWQKDRPGDGPTTLTPIGEPGKEHRCLLCRSAGRDQVPEKAANPTTWPLLRIIMSSLKTHAEMVKQNLPKPFTKSPVY